MIMLDTRGELERKRERTISSDLQFCHEISKKSVQKQV